MSRNMRRKPTCFFCFFLKWVIPRTALGRNSFFPSYFKATAGSRRRGKRKGVMLIWGLWIFQFLCKKGYNGQEDIISLSEGKETNLTEVSVKGSKQHVQQQNMAFVKFELSQGTFPSFLPGPKRATEWAKILAHCLFLKSIFFCSCFCINKFPTCFFTQSMIWIDSNFVAHCEVHFSKTSFLAKFRKLKKSV